MRRFASLSLCATVAISDSIKSPVCGLASAIMGRACSTAKLVSGALEAMRCYVLAELFREEGSIYADRGEQQEALLRLSKGARLYGEALSRSEGDDALPSLVGLRALLTLVHAADLPFATAAMLVDELLRYEQFELVDNLLFELQDEQDNPLVAQLVSDSYAAMLQASDDQLATAGLERAEVEAAVAGQLPQALRPGPEAE